MSWYGEYLWSGALPGLAGRYTYKVCGVDAAGNECPPGVEGEITVGGPQMAIYTIDKQAFHQIPDGLPTFERLPKR